MPTNRPVNVKCKVRDLLGCSPDIEDLALEVSGWRDNFPDNLKSSPKYDQVSEIADVLESQGPELDDACAGIIELLERAPGILDKEIDYVVLKMYKGYQEPRWVRLSNIISAVHAAIGFISWGTDEPPPELSSEDVDSLTDYIEQARDALSELETVEFPPMYG